MSSALSHHPLPKLARLTAPSDYGDVSFVLNFFSTVVSHIRVNIVNDALVEIDEVFSASLSLVNPTTDARVHLRPNSSEVTIMNDCECKVCYFYNKYV